MEDIVRRLDFLRGNTADVSPDNISPENKILELFLEKTKKDFKIGELKK